MRRVSSASLASSSHVAPTYPECSAKYHLRNTKLTIDFSVLPAPDDPLPELAAGVPLLSCSATNVLFFSRGNRVHYKNLMTTTEDVGQLCKLQDSHGDLRIIECGGTDQPDVVALGTSKGLVQIWDVKAKKTTASWSTKGVSVMRWNGPVLTVGGLKGTIRHYDTRVALTSKMKEQARKVTRHQSRITSLEWNVDGKILASGDQSGTVYCWDLKEKVPLDIGEFIQRRKKMQHGGAISVSLYFFFVDSLQRRVLMTRLRHWRGVPGSQSYLRPATFKEQSNYGPSTRPPHIPTPLSPVNSSSVRPSQDYTSPRTARSFSARTEPLRMRTQLHLRL